MNSSGVAPDIHLPRWLAVVALVLLSLGSTVSCLPNGWAQDDLPIIGSNPALHTIARPWAFFTRAYWPPPFPPDLYRPLTSLSLATEWVAGRGHAVVLHAVSVALYLIVVLLVYRLARRLVDPAVAWVAAAWFAVQPVHVEDVAPAVNQAELVVAAITLAVMISYLDRRRSRTITGTWIATTTVAYAIAMLYKESGLMLPGFMLAAELTVLATDGDWRRRWRELRPLALSLVAAVVVVLGIRVAALHGNPKGSFTAEALQGLGIGGRALTMLQVVPQWIRLFFWPAHLRADYSPQVINAATQWGAIEILGVLILVAVVVLAWTCRRRFPVVTFGILWTGVALFPVSDVIVPSGIVLAERTLLIPTFGVVLAVSPLLVGVGRWLYAHGSVGRIVVASSAAALLGMGLSRSFARQSVWHDQTTLWFQTLIDAPNSYRAHHAFAEILFAAKAERSAEYHYREAMRLYPPAWPVDLDLADKYRQAGDCYAADRLYAHVLTVQPAHVGARGSFVACLMYIGDYVDAAAQARLGASFGHATGTFASYAQIADSAARAHAPPHSVQLPPPPDSTKP